MGAVASCSDKRGWSLHMRIHQMDVQTAFLNGHLKEEIYMMQPEGSVKPGQEHLVCVKYYTSMSLVFYSISRRASLRESKQNQQEVHDQEVEAEAEAEAVSRTKNRTKS